jgi:3-methyladenine DNA glycosylase AlkD
MPFLFNFSAMHSISQDVLHALSIQANPKAALEMKQYMRNQFEFFGVNRPERAIIIKHFVKTLKAESFEVQQQVLLELWHTPQREAQYIALEFCKQKSIAQHSLAIPLAEQLICTKSWWDTVDMLASHMVGITLFNFPNLKAEYIVKWLNSEDIWLNRTAILFQLFYKEETDFQLLKHCILTLKHKNEFFIQKAIGWSLRQYAKSNPDEVFEFVEQTELSNLAKREALKHFN